MACIYTQECLYTWIVGTSIDYTWIFGTSIGFMSTLMGCLYQENANCNRSLNNYCYIRN